MPTITIREQQQTDKGFEATIAFDGHTEYSITISDPFTLEQEKELEWYFEEWLIYPMENELKAEKAAASIEKYGKDLFQKVFQTNTNVFINYVRLRNDLSQLQIEIIGKTPEFQALHWEALRDTELPRPLAIDCAIVRKKVAAAAIPANVRESPVINLLVVVARPDGEKDLGYRTISRPLVELIENSQLLINVELLRPGTYEALSRHLEEKGEGYYHIIHLDLHGTLLTYQQIQNPPQPNRYLCQGRFGREDIKSYQGVKAFLAFETDKQTNQVKVDLVEATELANLLTGKRIPVCILNACQSGKQIKQQGETSLGSYLMAAGMQIVVAMRYSFTASGAKLMMQQSYQHLFDKKDITTAIRLGRRELFNIKQRQAYWNQTIDLEDWLLPVTYYNRPVNLNLRKFTPQEETDYFLSRSQRYQFPIPTYGFVGRDLEILKIEKMLLRHNILMLRGIDGIGKTTLLNYLREWWQTTHFAQKIFYFSYEEKACTLQQIALDIGKQVFEDKYKLAIFQTRPIEAQVEQLIGILRSQPHGLMLDNLELVKGQQLEIQNTLPESEKNQIRDFLIRLVDGKTKIVFGSSSEEEWLQNTFQNNVYQLQGLDTESRSILAEKILERHVAANRIKKIREDDNFQRLMNLLAGNPLAMQEELANLNTQTLEEILSRL